jgi:Short C-terminal domain
LRNLSEARSVEQSYSAPQRQNLSLADELSKVAKLKEEGIISETEFSQMKQELIKKLA